MLLHFFVLLHFFLIFWCRLVAILDVFYSNRVCNFMIFFASLCSQFMFFWLSGHIWLHSVVISPLFVVIQCNFMAVLRLILVFCATLNL